MTVNKAESMMKTIDIFMDWKKNVLSTYDKMTLDRIPEALEGVASPKEAYMFISYVKASCDLFDGFLLIKDYENLIDYLPYRFEKKRKQA